jgi:hypothetical protein
MLIEGSVHGKKHTKDEVCGVSLLQQASQNPDKDCPDVLHVSPYFEYLIKLTFPVSRTISPY